MLKVAMLSKWHVHAPGYASKLKSFADAGISVVWDEEPERGRAWAGELGVPFEPDLEKACGRDDVDAVAVNAPTNRHAEVMIAAAKAGKHVFTEKVMALTVAECEAIAAAVRQAGVKFCISMPARCSAANQFAKQVADDKLIGELTLLRARSAHNGAVADWLPPHFYDPVACGGGAMMDLGAHPMYLARWICGAPRRITSMFNTLTDRAVEDNAVCTIEFGSGAVAVVETAFVSTHSPGCLELYGTEGTLLIGGSEGGVRLRSNKVEASVPGWIVPARLPPARPEPIRQWVTACLSDAEPPFTLEDGIQLTELMEAAYVAHREGRTVGIRR